MRVSSASDVPRSDLATLKRLVPALWAEWAALEFTSQGWLRDPDTAQPLAVVRLTHGRHRVAGAEYVISSGQAHATFALVSDDRRTVRGTVTGQPWQVDLEINDRVSAAARVDVGAALRASDTPGCLIRLIGGREATGSVELVPAALEHSGDLVTGQAQAQRVRADLTCNVKVKRDVWHGRITMHVKGRGLIGRLALLALRWTVRRELQKGLAEFWADTATEVAGFQADLASLDADIAAAGGEQAWLHRTLWEALRDANGPPTPTS